MNIFESTFNLIDYEIIKMSLVKYFETRYDATFIMFVFKDI